MQELTLIPKENTSLTLEQLTGLGFRKAECFIHEKGNYAIEVTKEQDNYLVNGIYRRYEV
jgi:hypothetical protein